MPKKDGPNLVESETLHIGEPPPQKPAKLKDVLSECQSETVKMWCRNPMAVLSLGGVSHILVTAIWAAMPEINDLPMCDEDLAGTVEHSYRLTSAVLSTVDEGDLAYGFWDEARFQALSLEVHRIIKDTKGKLLKGSLRFTFTPDLPQERFALTMNWMERL